MKTPRRFFCSTHHISWLEGEHEHCPICTIEKAPGSVMPRIISQFVDYLFTDGSGHKAHRLVMEFDKELSGPGWCRRAIIDKIYDSWGLDYSILKNAGKNKKEC